MCEFMRIGDSVAFVCTCDPDERMARAHWEYLGWVEEQRQAALVRNRVILESLSAPDPVEDRSFIVTLPGRRRVRFREDLAVADLRGNRCR